jgi:hypothetical protein
MLSIEGGGLKKGGRELDEKTSAEASHKDTVNTTEYKSTTRRIVRATEHLKP